MPGGLKYFETLLLDSHDMLKLFIRYARCAGVYAFVWNGRFCYVLTRDNDAFIIALKRNLCGREMTLLDGYYMNKFNGEIPLIHNVQSRAKTAEFTRSWERADEYYGFKESEL